MLNADKLTDEWLEGTLKRDTVRDYLMYNLGALRHMSVTELEHVADLCFKLFEWSAKGTPAGDFLTAVIKNDLSEAAGRADATNMHQLWIYPAFIYNVAPRNWRDKPDEKDAKKACSPV